MAYLWATDPGARTPPSAGQQASGFVPGTPASPGIVNDVIGELTDAFAFQHDIVTGAHGDITAGNITAADLTVDDITADNVVVSAIVSGAYQFSTPGVQLFSYHYPVVTRGDASMSAVASGVPIAEMNPGEFCYIDLGSVGANVDLDRVLIYALMVGGLAWSLDYDLVTFNSATASYTSTGVTGTVGGVSSVGALVPVNFTLAFPDTNGPNVVGHGVHFIGPSALFLRLENVGANIIGIHTAYRELWVYYVHNALGGI